MTPEASSKARRVHHLGARLRAKRLCDGLTVRDVEAATGISFSSISRIERGQQPRFQIEQRLEAWLDGRAPPVRPTELAERVSLLEEQVAKLLSAVGVTA